MLCIEYRSQNGFLSAVPDALRNIRNNNTAVHNTSGNYCASAPCANNIPSSAIVAWLSYNSGNNDIHYNISNCCYSFKPGAQGPQQTAAQADGWQVYPNPAMDELTIVGADCRYTITDMPGRCLRAGETSGKTAIDIHGLATGSYIIKIDGNEGSHTSRIFVKE